MRYASPVALLLWAFAACGGNDGSLIDIQYEPPGEHCPAGGSAILTGPDDNGNGQLDADEVTETSYLCNEDAPPPSLVSIDVEPSGENCEFGGIAVSSGVDDDGSGTLEAEEVDATTFVCDEQSITDLYGTVIPGSIVISDYIDLVVFSQFSEVLGDVTIEATALQGVPDLNLGNLVAVGGALTITDSGYLGTIDLSSLEQVGGAFHVSQASALTSFDLSALATTGDLVLTNVGTDAALLLPALTSIDTGNLQLSDGGIVELNAPLLTAIGGSLLFSGGATCGDVSLPALASVGGQVQARDAGTVLGNIDLSGLTALGTNLDITLSAVVGDVNISALAALSNIYVDQNAAAGAIDASSLVTISNDLWLHTATLASIDLSELTTIASDLELRTVQQIASLSAPKLTALTTDDFEVIDNPALTDLSFPMLTTIGTVDNFVISGNDDLTTLDFASLTTVEGLFWITDNATLPCSEVEPIEAGLTSTPSSIDISGNLTNCVPS